MVPEAQREHGASAAADAGVAESAPLLTLDADCAASVSLTQPRGGEVVGEGEEDAGEDEEGLSLLAHAHESDAQVRTGDVQARAVLRVERCPCYWILLCSSECFSDIYPHPQWSPQHVSVVSAAAF